MKEEQADQIIKLLKRIEDRVTSLQKSLDPFVMEKLNPTHRKILEMLDSWISTAELAEILGFRHEYVSRKIAELRKANLVESRREGRKILYQKSGKPTFLAETS